MDFPSGALSERNTLNRESQVGAERVLRKSLLAVSLWALTLSAAHGSILTGVSVNPGTPFEVGSILEFSVQGQDMGPMTVEAHYSDGISTATWNSALEKASSTGRFELSQPGDTYPNSWALLNLDASHLLLKLVIKAAPGNTVFDLQGPTYITSAGSVTPGKFDVSEQTSGSQKGSTFKWMNEGAFYDNLDPDYFFLHSVDVAATYSDIVNLTSQPAMGDLWTTLTIEFSGGMAGGLVDDIVFRFDADTDIFLPAATAAVPEPSSLSLMLGLGLVGAWRYRRSHR
jgi:hypothetical protein